MASKFITISVEIMRDENLSQSQKFILAEIEQLSSLEKGCIATNQHFSELIGIAKETVSRSIKDLESKGYVQTEIKNGSRNHMRIITIDKISSIDKKSSPPKQKVKPPLTKSQETKENKTINKTINNNHAEITPIQIINLYKNKVCSKQTKIKEMTSFNKLSLIKSDFEKIIIGINNYSLKILGTEEKYIINLTKFLEDKIYLDYQIVKEEIKELDQWK